MSWTYAKAKAVLATMHGKEAVIAPAMLENAGIDVVTAASINTDLLGTFTGDVPRVGTMRDVAVRKARLGMEVTGLPVGIASEGSFGPHPVIPFIKADIELIVLVDDDHGLVLTESLVAAESNHDEIIVGDRAELNEFLLRVGFPQHALVVTPNLTQSSWWRIHPEFARGRKGIATYEELAEAVYSRALRSEDRRARVTTDMRAHMNPTWMKVIAKLANQFARRIAHACPECGAPGFGRVGPSHGLRCRVCGEESTVRRGDRLACIACNCEREQPCTQIRAFAEPEECPSCNP
jgi:hypothetical protein